MRALRPSEPIWVGLLDLDRDEAVTQISGLLRPDHSLARVLIRMHGAPIGYVHVPIRPASTLTTRARLSATESLGKAMHRHGQLDSADQEPDGRRVGKAWTACPRRFPTRGGAGVTVVVCTRDRTSELMEYCLPALRKISYEPLEILVVDNAPSLDTTRKAVAELAADDPRVRYVCEPRPGLSRARNLALARAQFDLIAYTDDDTVPDSGWVAALAAGFLLDPEAVCVTGAVVSGALETACQRYFEARYTWGEVFEPRQFDLGAHRHPSRLYPFSAGIFGAGANFAIRRQAALRAGGFDSLLGAGGLGRGGEDLDLFLRLVLAGGRIDYVPSALVWHRHRADIVALSEQLYSYGHGLGAYLAKHLANRDLRAALRGDGLRESTVALGRMRKAAQASHLGGNARRLALAETRGMIVGALRYRRAARTEARAGLDGKRSGPED